MSPPRAGRRAAVLGSPVAHSLSPVLHRAAYAQLGLDWTYDAVEVGEGGLAAFVASLDPTWAGLSLTMPLKREALELARVRSETATLTRAANTLVPLGSGWQAENTDVPGMVAALAATGLALPSRAVVLGGGATAASTLVALGRSGVRAVGVAVRRPEAGDVLRSLAERIAVVLDVRPWDDVPVLLDGAGLVVSTVPTGATDRWVPAVPAEPGLLFDVVYDPWPTPLAAAWAARGGRVLGGLDLLVHQAALQVELMTGAAPDVAGMLAAGRAALAAR